MTARPWRGSGAATRRLVAWTVALTAGTAHAQPPQRVLPRAEVEYPEPFTAISGLRELRDGRLIVADARESTLQLLDLRTARATPIGRKGGGPREWGFVGPLLPLPGDTTLLIDFANRRLLVIHPDGTPGRTEAENERDPLWRGAVVGVDSTGRVLVVISRPPSGPLEGSVGVADVLRLSRRGGRADTVGTLQEPKGERTAASMLPGGRMQMATNLPLAAQDAAVLTPDGRAVLVRAAPYRLEFVTATGARTMGPIADAPRIRITQGEKEAFLRSQVRPGAMLIRSEGDASAGSTRGRATSRPKMPAISRADFEAMMKPDMTWPSEKPAFRGRDAIHAAPDGRVWVERARAHDDSIPVFDVFDRSGRVVERVALPMRTRIAGFGAGVIYLARTDEDDLLWLQRVRLGR